MVHRNSTSLNDLPGGPYAADSVITQWWPLPESTRKLQGLAKVWYRFGPSESLADLGSRMYELYCARQRLQPYPELVVAMVDNTPAALLTGHADRTGCQYCIHGTAVHPAYRDNSLAHKVLAALIDAAVDASVARGWHGWVTYDTEDAPHQHLLDLGFTASSPFYYRKMGYFS